MISFQLECYIHSAIVACVVLKVTPSEDRHCKSAMHLHLKQRAIEGLLGFEFAEGALEFHGPHRMNGEENGL